MLVPAPVADSASDGPSQHLETPATQAEQEKCSTQKRRQKSVHETKGPGLNAILIDFFLYDTMKELESDGQESIPHHRTRSIWY